MTAPALVDLVAPERCALLLQEVQNGVVGRPDLLGGLAEAAEEVGLIDNLQKLTAAARAAGVVVVHCTASQLAGGFGANENARLFAAARRAGVLHDDGGNSEFVDPVPSLLGPGDLVLPRYHGLSPLTGSQLDSLLRNEGLSTIVATGVSLNVAIPNLVFDAVNRSYQAVVPVDAVAGVPVDYGRQVIEHTLRPLATLTTADELVSVWS
jgi:nicotinamidase-related amidase